MKRLLLILTLTFSFQSLSNADDIRDFEIEGMSIGESLLEYVQLKTIKKSRRYNYNSNRFYTLDLILDKFTNYYAVQVHLKKDDMSYQIHGLSGAIKFGKAAVYYPKSKNECKKQMYIIENEIDKIFSNSDKEKSGEYIGQGDYDPKAIRDEIYYTVNTGEIYLQCVTWSKKVKKKENLFDSLRVSIMNNKFSYWLSNEAYK